MGTAACSVDGQWNWDLSGKSGLAKDAVCDQPALVEMVRRCPPPGQAATGDTFLVRLRAVFPQTRGGTGQRIFV